MGTSSFQAGTALTIDNKPYILKKKIDDDLWQLEEIKSGRIIEHSQAELEQLYVADALRFESSHANPIFNRNSKSEVAISDGVAHQDFSQDEWAKAKIKRAYAV